MSASVWSDVRGQETPIELLKRSARRGRLAHGYAFFGPRGIGRRLIASKLAQCLFCEDFPDTELEACGRCPACKQVIAKNHPDLLFVSKPEGKRELPIDLIAGRVERRGREGLCFELAMKPMSAGRRIAIIDDAETMNAESANALLKTLEEPPPGSLMVLLASSPDALLPTILSRVQPLHLASLADSDLADLLVLSGSATAAEAGEISPLSGGSLETARQLLDGELGRLRRIVIQSASQIPFDAVQTAASLNRALDDLGGDAAQKRVQADWALRFLVDFFRSALLSVASGHTTSPEGLMANRLTTDSTTQCERVGRAIERVVSAEEAIARMTPVPLAIEGLCDDLSAILRGADRRVLEPRS